MVIWEYSSRWQLGTGLGWAHLIKATPHRSSFLGTSLYIRFTFFFISNQNSNWLWVISLHLPSICFHFSDCLLGVFSQQHCPSPSTPPPRISVCHSKGQSPDGSLYHKEKHNRSHTVSRLTGKWDFRRDRDKMRNYQCRECVFPRQPLSKKRVWEKRSKATK